MKTISQLRKPPRIITLLLLSVGVFMALLVVHPGSARAEEAVAVQIPYNVVLEASEITDGVNINPSLSVYVYAKNSDPNVAVTRARGESVPSLRIGPGSTYDYLNNPTGTLYWVTQGTMQATIIVPSPTQTDTNPDDYQYQLCAPEYDVCSDWVAATIKDGRWWFPMLTIYLTKANTTNGGNGPPYTYDPSKFTVPPTDKPIKCEDVQQNAGWAVCVVLSWADEIISNLERGLMNLLTVDRLYGAEGDGLYKVWGTMRNIALIILIPMMLVMVLGTALDFGPFDAYTVKKALPRMVAAVIFIVLSWKICTFLIDLSDIVGVGTYHLITSVAGAGEDITLASLVENNSNSGAAGLSGVGVFGTALAGAYVTWALGAASFGIILSMAISAVMALFIGYLSLAIRLIIILGLLVFAPIFILSWIFPGNDKMWKFWKTTFMSMLLLFPIITGVIAIGKVGAYIVSQM